MAYGDGARRPEATSFSRVIEGQDTRKKSLDLGYKAEAAENCRFGDEVGSVTKRSVMAYYNTTELMDGPKPSPIDSIYRYYKQNDSTQYLFQLNSNLLQVGNDAAGTFSTLKTFSQSDGKRFTAVTYKDLAIISTGYDPITISDGKAAWELGSCKAALKTAVGLVDVGDHSYAITFSNSTGEITTRTGSTTSQEAFHLHDSTANFGAETNPTKIGMLITNTSTTSTDNWAIIDTIVSPTDLLLKTNIFTLASGELYSMSIPVTGDVITGAHSNTVTTDGTHGKVTLTHIPLGPVNCIARNIYRTAVGTPNQYKFLYRINDNSTETYEDNIADSALTLTLGTATDPIPKGKYLHITDERLFVTGDVNHGSYIYFTDQYLPHYFPSDNYDIVGEDEGDVITGIKDYLSMTFVFKQNSIRPWYVQGLPETWQLGKIVSTIGAPVPYSIVNVQDGIIYQGWDHMYKFNGQYSLPIIDEFNIDREILEERELLSVGFFWNNLYLMAYTDHDDANVYHDRMLVWDTLRQELSIDKGGAITQGTGNTQINCFASMKGHEEWGQLYVGDSVRGFVYQCDRIINELTLGTVTDLNLGTYEDCMASGEEDNPTLGKLVLDDMETYTTDELAQAAWITSATELVPADLGDGTDGDLHLTVATPSVYWTADANYTNVLIDAGVTVTVQGDVTVHCQGTFDNYGTILVPVGNTLHVYSYTFTNEVSGHINGNIYIECNTLNNYGTMENDVTASAVITWYGGSGSITDACPHGGSDFCVGSTSDDAVGHCPAGSFSMGKRYNFPTTVNAITVTVNVSAGQTGDGGAAYCNTNCGWSLYDINGTVLDGDGRATAGRSTATGAISQTYTTPVSGTWANVSSALVSVSGTRQCNGWHHPASIWGTIGSDALSFYGTIHVVYVHSNGTVPPSGPTDEFIKALEVFSEAGNVSQGIYSLRVLCSAGAVTQDATIIKTINPMDLSDIVNEKIIVDVYAQRAGTNFQFGMGEGGVITYWVNVPVTASNVWEPVILDFSLMLPPTDRDAIDTIAFKFTDTTGYNRILFDNIRSGFPNGQVASSIYTSQVFFVNAGTMGNMYWNENLAVEGAITHGEVLVYTRSGMFLDITGTAPSDTDGGPANAWDGPITEPAGSAIPSLPAKYFQFKVEMSTNDLTGIYFPWLFKADGYVIRATFWKLIIPAESAITFRYKTGYRNFELPFADKIFRKAVSVHKGSVGTFNFIVDVKTSTYTFVAISLTTFPERWVSNLPSTMYGPELSVEWYKNDNADFIIKQYGIIMEPCPLI
jgi:hypothetical protein